MAILSEGMSIEFYQADSSAEGPRDQEVCDPWNLCFPSIGNVSWSIEDWKNAYCVTQHTDYVQVGKLFWAFCQKCLWIKQM